MAMEPPTHVWCRPNKEKTVRTTPCPSTFNTGLFTLFFAVFVSSSAFATNVLIETPLGDIKVELFDEETPFTVGNFLNYVATDLYVDSFIHRSEPNFVVQGGGFIFQDGVASDVLTGIPIPNEPGISNTRGTIAMAKQPGNPNSATSQWFINVADNSESLDEQNGGFTVFGEVIGDGMLVVDAINDLPLLTLFAPFERLPLIDYPGSGNILQENIVFTNISVLPDFVINAGLNDAWFNSATAGQGFFITVFPDRGEIFLAWFTYDTERPPESVQAILGAPGARWLTAFGEYENNTAVLEIELTQGGIFDAASPVPTQSNDGTITLEFSDCENGLVTYDIPSIDQQGEIPIERIALDNVARCEQLAAGE